MDPARTRLAATLLAWPVLMTLACAHPHRVDTTRTVECVEVRDDEGNALERECEITRERTRRDRDHCHGVLSCTGHTVGEVVALPFRITGAVLDVLF